LKNTQKVQNKSKINNLTRNGSNAYLENELNFKVENEIASCEHYNCNYKTDNFFEAEEHWYKNHSTSDMW
jgi:hypothetical protein